MSNFYTKKLENSSSGGSSFLLGLYLGLTTLLIISNFDASLDSSIRFLTNIYCLQAVAGAVLGFWRLWVNSVKIRTPLGSSLFLICISLSSWALAQLLWIYGTFTFKAIPYPWWSDIFYIFSIIFWITGQLKLFRVLERRLVDETTPLITIIGGLWFVIVAVVLWLNRNLVESPATSQTIFLMGCDFAYIISTGISMLLAFALVLGKNKTISFPFNQCLHYLCVATVINVIANIAFVVTTKLPQGEILAYYNGNAVDWLLLTAMYCWGVSAVKCPISEQEIRYNFDTIRDICTTKDDFYQAGKVSEDYLHSKFDSRQMLMNSESIEWILKEIPDCWRLIKLGDLVIGSTLIFPVSRHIMEKFILRKITEREMFEEVKNSPLDWECLYLASASILAEHRKRGLAFNAMEQTISRTYSFHKSEVKKLFCWAITSEGRELGKKLSKHFESKNLELILMEGKKEIDC